MKQNIYVKFHSEMLIEELEARQLFSGGVEAILIDNNEPEVVVNMDVTTESEEIKSTGLLEVSKTDSMRQELVFIDTDVENYQQLLNDILRQGYEDSTIEVILLDSQHDGVEQITETLENFQNLDAVHLISHGSEGSVKMGRTTLDSETLFANLAEISAWGDSFTEEGDFLIYGCNLAETETGQSLVNMLSELTLTDVAASDDLTGHTSRGGDWELEYSSGNIETEIAVTADFQQSYDAVLADNTAPAFGIGDGIVTTSIGSGDDYGRSITIQLDGKILVGGYAENGLDTDFALTRYNSDGTLDTSFGGGDGIVTTNISSILDYGSSITVQADGKILLGGYSFNGSNYDFTLTRYDSDGLLDSTFGGGDGIVTTAIGTGDARGYSIAMQSDGKILVGGYSDGVGKDMSLVRYDSNGVLDTSFGGGDGIVTTDIASSGLDLGYSITVQSDDKILLTGSTGISSVDVALIRYTSDGTLDTSFGGGDGIVTTAIGAGIEEGHSVTMQSDGKILVGGYSNNGTTNDALLIRYNSDGTLDTANFGGGDGFVTTGTLANDYFRSVIVQSDGKILAAGSNSDSSLLVRYNSDGTLDNTFGVNGITTTVGSGNLFVNSVAIQSDGKILLSGYDHNGTDLDFTLLRYNSDGTLDTSFDAVNTLDGTPSFTEDGTAVVLDADVQVFDQELTLADNFDGATLSLIRNGGTNVEDIFSATGTLSALTEGGNLTVGATTIGTVTTNSNGTLLLTFNTNATNTLVNQAMQQIAYANSSDAPPASAQIDWTFNDGNTGTQGTGGALDVTGSTTVNITAIHTLSGTVFSDEGITNAGAGLTVRLLVNGVDVGTAVTDAGGNYTVSMVSELLADDTIAAFIDDSAYEATTASVVAGGDVSGFDLYANHVITRSDYGASLDNSELATAVGAYIDTDILYNADGSNNITINGGDEFYIAAGHTFDASANITMTNMESAGTFNGGSATVDINGILLISGGTYNATSATTFIEDDFTFTSGTFNANGGTFLFDKTSGGMAINSGTATLNNVVINKGGAGVGITGTLDIDGDLNINSAWIINGGTINVAGNVSTADSDLEGTVVIRLDGSADQLLTSTGSGRLTSVDIDKSAGLLTIQDIGVYRNWTYTAGNVDATGRVSFVDTPNISIDSAGMTFNDVTINKGNGVNLVSNMDVDGDFRLQKVWQLNNSTITVAGNLTSVDTRSGSGASGSAGFVLDGTGTQIIDMNGGSGRLSNGDLFINKASGTVQLASNLALDASGQSLILQSGTFDAADYTVTVNNGVQLVGGTYLANGTIAGSLAVNSGGILQYNVTGYGMGQYDTLAVTGSVTLGADSHLGVDLTGIGTGGIADDVLTYGSLSGTFTAIDVSNNPDSYEVFALYDSPAGAMDIQITRDPVISLPGGAVNFIEDAGPVLIDANVVITDADGGDFDGGLLTVDITAGGTANDRLIIETGGNVTLSGSDVLVSGTIIGTFAGGTSATPLIVTWNSNSNAASAQEATRQIAYNNLSHNPDETARTVRFVLTDGNGGSSNTETETINISAVNDAPVNTVPGQQTIITETTTAIVGVSIDDVDAAGANLTTRMQVTNGVLDITLSGSAIISAGSDGSGDLTILGTITDINDTLTSLSYTGNAGIIGTSADTLTITTDDAGNSGSGGILSDVDTIQIDLTNVSISATDAAASETATDNGQFTVDLGAVNNTGGDVTVNYTVTGTASATGDYTALTGTVVIANGQQTATINISGIVDDALIEGSETVIVTIDSTDNGLFTIDGASDNATVTISDNDSALNSVSISATDANASETATDNGEFTVDLGAVNNTGADVTVSYTVTGTATATGDYTALTGTVVIANGQQTAIINVSGIVDDALIEGSESVIVTIDSTDNGLFTINGASDNATVTISDNDSALVKVSISATDAAAAETGSDPGQFTVDLGAVNNTGSDVTVNYTVTGTASATGDYTALTGTVVVADGQQTATIDVSGIVDDALIEGGETVIVTIDSTDNALFSINVFHINGDSDNATVTISDNDSALNSVSISANDATAAETATDNGQFTVDLGAVNNTGGDITVNYTVTGTASATGDYTALTGTVVIADGQQTATIDVNGIVDDALVEGSETVIVTIDSTDNGLFTIDGTSDNATVTISDNDSALNSVSISATDAAASETATDNGQFTVDLGAVNNTGADVTVNYTVTGTASATGDYTALTGTVVVANGQQTATIDVSGIVDDALIEGSETVIVTIDSTDNGLFTIDGASDNATVTISDNDSALNSVSISATDANASETATDNGEFTVDLGAVNNTGADVTVSYTVTGTATATGDYTALTGTVVIANGSQSATIDVSGIVDDALIEGSETVIVTIDSNSSGLFTIDGASDNATVTITDNDSALNSVSISATDATASETATDNGQFTVDLGAVNNTGADVTVSYTVTGTASATGDYTALTGTVVVANGQQAATIDVSGIVDDALIEGSETVIVTIDSTSSGLFTIDGASDNATVTISDNDSALNSVSISVTDAAAAETATDNGQFEVDLGAVNNTGGDVTVSYTVSGTATATGDYTALSGTVVIADGNQSATIDVSGIIDDVLSEGNETVIVTLDSTDNGLFTIDVANDSDTVTITDNDSALNSVSISATDAVAAETGSDPGQFTVDLGAVNNTGADVTVSYTVTGTASATGDYTALTGSVVVANGQQTETIDVSGIVDDALIEGSETVIVTIDSTDNGLFTINGGSDNATVTISDNDATVPPTAANNTVTTNEDTTYTFSATDFNFSDVDLDILASIKITALESTGALKISGVDITLNQVITKAELDAGNLTFVPVADANGGAYDSFEFSVNDGTTDSVASYTLTIDVTAINDDPEITSDGGGISVNLNVAENQAAVTTVTANDVDTDTLAFSISDGADASLFNIDTAGGNLTFKVAPDFETQVDADSNGIYEVEITASDGNGGADIQALSINVTDINEFAIGVVSDSNTLANTVAEDAANGSVVGITALATDADGSDTVTYSLTNDAGGLFNIDSHTGVITVANGLDYEKNGLHNVRVLASSNDGSTKSQNFTINVLEVNDTFLFPEEPSHFPREKGEDEKDYMDSTPAPVEMDITPLDEGEVKVSGNTFPFNEIIPTLDLYRYKVEANEDLLGIYKPKTSGFSFYDAPPISNELELRKMTFMKKQSDQELNLFHIDEPIANHALWRNVNLMIEQGNDAVELHGKQELEIELIAGATIGITAGVVNWVCRGGVLLSSLLSSATMLSKFDPLAVVFRNTKNDITKNESETEAEAEDSNSIDELFDIQNNKEQKNG